MTTLRHGRRFIGATTAAGLWTRASGLPLAAACLVALMVHAAATDADASLTRASAGARNMGEAGGFIVDAAWQRETAGDERTWSLEAAAQYEASTRLQLLMEAVLHESRRDDEGSNAGRGATDLTISWLVLRGDREWPPLVAAVRARLPGGGGHADSKRLGTWAALLATSHESGRWELSLELEMERAETPPDAVWRNTFSGTVTVELALTDHLTAFTEGLGQREGGDGASWGRVLAAGLEWEVPLTDLAAPYFALDADTEGVVSARAGIECEW